MQRNLSSPRAAGVLIALVASVAVAACGGSTADSAAKRTTNRLTLRTSASERAVIRADANAAVAPTSTAQGFLGIAIELSTIPVLAGPATHPDTALVPLLRNLSQGAPLLLRLGGESTDDSWWATPGMKKPAPYFYTLTPRWAASVRALLTAMGAKALLGVNLRHNSKWIARAEVAGYDRYIGKDRIDALELGNEPEAYGLGMNRLRGHLVHTGYRRLFVRYGKRFGSVASALGGAALAGPGTGSPHWIPKLSTVLKDMPRRRLKLVTVHAYALKACSNDSLKVSQFFTHAAIQGFADSLHPAVEAAAAHGKPLRVDEINGDPCGGYRGVSDSFGEALWALNVLPALWRAGVQGVNIQTIDGGRFSNYNQVITAKHLGAGWRVSVEPEYYGLLAFADVAPAGSHLLRISDPGVAHLYQFAVRAPDDSERVVMTNVGSTARTVGVTASHTGGSGSVSLLSARSLSATAGTTLNGQTVSARTGQLTGPPRHTLITPNAAGVYGVHVPPHAAAILTLSP